MKQLMLKQFGLPVLLWLGAVTPAAACCMHIALGHIQTQNVILQNHTNKMMHDSNRSAQEKRNQGEASSSNSSKKSIPSNAPARTNTAYQPSAQVTAKVREQMATAMVNELRKRGRHTPENEQTLRRELAKLQLYDVTGKELQKYGLQSNDVASAFTFFLGTGFGILEQKDDYPTDHIKALYQQTKGIMADAMGPASDAAVQAVAEALYWTAITNAIDYGNAKQGTPGYTMDNVRASVTQSMKAMAVDPAQLSIGKTGLVRAR